jgi:hypothetical protein
MVKGGVFASEGIPCSGYCLRARNHEFWGLSIIAGGSTIVVHVRAIKAQTLVFIV